MPHIVKNLTDLPEVDVGIDETSEFYKRNVVPVDRGWAWVICFAGFMVYFVFGVSNQTLVVLFVELTNFYDTTITSASLVFMFSVFSVGFMSIISTNCLAPRYGERAVVSVAGVLTMFGSLGLSFAPNITHFIGWAILKGMATGAVFVPSISLIRLYFQNRRSIAQIIANAGQSFAVIIVPPVIRIIRKEYGISGTFIVAAGIDLHITLAGLLLRPISAYRYRPRIAKTSVDLNAMNEVMISEDYNEYKLKTNYKDLARRISRHVSAAPSYIRRNFTKTDSRKERSASTADGTLANKDGRKASRLASRASIGNRSQTSFGKRVLSYATIKRHPSIRGSSSVENPEDVVERRWLFRMVILATIPGSANLYVRNYVPAITKSQGATLDQSALLLTILGATDLLSRLCIGLFADTHILTSLQIIIITQLCLALVCHLLRLFTSFSTLVVFSLLVGCFVGTRISMLPLLSMEICGVENMPQALSILSTVGAISSAFMNPVFGSVAQKNKNYIVVMNMVGGCFILSSFIMICMPFVLHLRKFLISKEETDIEIESDIDISEETSVNFNPDKQLEINKEDTPVDSINITNPLKESGGNS